MSFEKEIEATLSISYPQGGGDENGRVSVRIEDRSSRTEFVHIEISYEEFAKALSSLQYRPGIRCRVRGLDRVGKTVNVETFKLYTNVELPSQWGKGGAKAAAQLLISESYEQGFGGGDPEFGVSEWIISPHFALHSQGGSGTDEKGKWYRMTRTRYI